MPQICYNTDTMNISYHDARHVLELKDVTTVQKAILFALLSHMHPHTKLVFPSYDTLSEELGCASKTVKRGINNLAAQGHLRVRKAFDHGRHHNAYIIPFSDGYQYKSENNDESIPKSLAIPSEETPARKTAKKQGVIQTYKEACEDIVYHTPIPSVFVDITLQELEISGYRDSYNQAITPSKFRGHVARIWKSVTNKSFFHALEDVWDEHWKNIKAGKYNNPDGTENEEKRAAALERLEEEYDIDWNQPIDRDNDMSPPNLIAVPVFTYYPDKQAIRAKNLPSNP